MNISSISVADYLTLRGLLTEILENHLENTVPMHEPEHLRNPQDGLTEEHYRWLMVLDLCATPAALRMAIQKLSPPDADLIKLLTFFLTQDRQVDHDRFEWLLTYLFKRRMETGELHVFGGIGAQVLTMLPGLPQTPLSSAARDHLAKLMAALEAIGSFSTLEQLMHSDLVSKGRELKEGFGEERNRPAALAAIVNYNLVLGRAFRKLFDMVAEQNRELAAQLATVDYRSNVERLRKLAKTSGSSVGDQPPQPKPNDAIRDPLLEVSSAGASPFTSVGNQPPQPKPNDAIRDPLLEVSSAGASPFTNDFTTGSPAPGAATEQIGMRKMVEQRRLRTAQEKLVNHFADSEDKPSNTVKVGDVALVFEDWEAKALATSYPAEEKSFRAKFAQALKDSGKLLYRLVEVIEQRDRNAASEHLRKPHDESLVWLQAQGQEHVHLMRQFAEEIGKRGLPEKQQQILISALRLADVMQGKRPRTAAAPLGDGSPRLFTPAITPSSES